MSRDDSLLSTGLSSAAARQYKEKKEEVKQHKPDASGEAVLGELNKMKSQILSIETIVADTSQSQEAQLEQIRQIRLKYDIIIEIEKRMKRILGVK